jgi:hypothetical protein
VISQHCLYGVCLFFWEQGYVADFGCECVDLAIQYQIEHRLSVILNFLCLVLKFLKARSIVNAVRPCGASDHPELHNFCCYKLGFPCSATRGVDFVGIITQVRQ